jgi:putative Holliday junction resolvase
MNILAIDVGEKRIGLAWVNTTIGVVLPFGVVKTVEELVKLINGESMDVIVVGVPLSMTGGETEHTIKIRSFAKNLSEKIGMSVEFFDERFSSKQADAMGGSVTRDEKSAMIILQSYIESRKLGK